MPLKDDRRDAEFRWDPPQRDRIVEVTPKPGLRVPIVTRRGAVSNADLYMSVPDTWLSGAPSGDLELVPTLYLYRLVAGGRHLLRTVALADVDNGVQWQRVNASTIHFQLVVARGFACDGFDIEIGCPSGVLSGAGFGPPGNGVLFTSGTETSGNPIGASETSQGAPIDVNVLSAIPVTVVGVGAATAWAELNGVAPDNTTLPFVSIAPIAPAPATQYVEVSADSRNAGTLYVASSALGVGGSDAAAYELAAGDSVRVAINNGNKVFVAGSAAGQLYRAAVV